MPATTKPEAAAQKVLRDIGIKKAPVSLELIAKRLEIELVQRALGDKLSGVLINKEGESIAIVVNSAHPENRRRFTIAHEIGHYVLGHPGEMFVDQTLRQKAVVVKRDGRSSEGTDKHEIEANRFAAELLMPGDLIEAEIAKRFSKPKSPNTKELVAVLAGQFQVSEQAMKIRFVNLGYLIPD